MKTEEEIVSEMQLVAEQMRLDDIKDNPESEFEIFECDACGEQKSLAGSIEYDGYRLCNDCVTIAETGFALNKIKNIKEVIDAMEPKRLEALCNLVKEEERKELN